MEHLKQHLDRQYNPAPLSGMDATVRLKIGSGSLTFHTDGGQLTWCEAEPDWTIILSSETTAHALFEGAANPIDLFMQGELRSTGYIVATFRVLQAFIPTGR